MPATVKTESSVQVPTSVEHDDLKSRVTALEAESGAGIQVFFRQHSGHQDLFRDFNPISGMSVVFSCDVPSRVILSGHIDAEHRALINDAVMVAVNAQIDGVWMPGVKTGGNIISPTHHYLMLPLSGYAEVDAGDHTVVLFGRSASSAAPDTDGLAELKPLYNSMIVRVEPL